jgi:hypothetical protein
VLSSSFDDSARQPELMPPIYRSGRACTTG